MMDLPYYWDFPKQKKNLEIVEQFPPPVLPTNFKPTHIFQSAEAVINIPDPKIYEMAMQMPSFMREQLLKIPGQPSKYNNMTSEDRGKMLGEEPLPSQSLPDNKQLLPPLKKNSLLAQRFTAAKIQYDDMKSDSESKEEIDDYQATAASLKMFGRMTRTTDTWYPEPLLCKRFNIANPYKKKI